VQADVRSLPLTVLTVLTVLAVVFVLHWARAVFIPLMLGVVISYAFSPLVDLMQKWRIPRAIGAAVLLVGTWAEQGLWPILSATMPPS
jgi:predicted PurR-regulated permease PerM